jgi:hypothetical protein
MSEVPDAPQFVEPPAPAEPPSNGDQPPVDESKPGRSPEQYEAEIAKLRKESAGYRTKLREVEPLAKAAQEAEEANKTEIQKAADRASKAEQALQEREIGYTRLDLAVQYNVKPDNIDLIGSGTREEMEANAQRLAALEMAASKAAPPPSDRPVEGLRPGAAPEPPKPADDSYPTAWTPSYLRESDSRSQYGQ